MRQQKRIPGDSSHDQLRHTPAHEPALALQGTPLRIRFTSFLPKTGFLFFRFERLLTPHTRIELRHPVLVTPPNRKPTVLASFPSNLSTGREENCTLIHIGAGSWAELALYHSLRSGTGYAKTFFLTAPDTIRWPHFVLHDATVASTARAS